ncbi:MAG: acetyl-CoA carboxylase carboxyltransferase subunit alpha [Armatimonadetes bacterium]|nr:acetyl-CoA carboxylase carboxyltransferase subunit alpha [Armatimonadota bacterium]
MARTVQCPSCGTVHQEPALAQALYVCPVCQTHLQMSARVRIALLADPRSFKELDRGLVSVDPLHFTDRRPYLDRLAEARKETGLREAVVIGEARIDRHRVVLIVFDFAFLGGTMGSVVGEKVADAFEHATRRNLPVVSVAASGGARMQEGMLSLMQMAKTAAAQAAHDRSGLAYVSVLADPTFGGVAASFASLGDVIIAEPGAQIGFVGPRVLGLTAGEQLPPDSHRAESRLRSGLVDLVVPRQHLRDVVAYLVSHLGPTPGVRRRAAERRVIHRGRAGKAVASWSEVQLARHPGRPTSADYIARLATRFVELHGDRTYGDDPAIITGLGELDGQTVVIVAQEGGRTEEEQQFRRRGMPMPEGYRKALRVMRLAEKFKVPIITFIDTPGASSGTEAEEHGIAQALARNLQVMAVLQTPIISVVIGEGGSGGALSLGVADRVFMLEHAIYSVISPEGAAAILFRDTSKAADVANALQITASDLLRLGIIDGIIPEPADGAHTDHDLAATHLRDALVAALPGLRRLPMSKLLRKRYDKFRHMGQVGIYWRQIVRTEMQELLEALEQRILRREHGIKQEESRPAGRKGSSDLPGR